MEQAFEKDLISLFADSHGTFFPLFVLNFCHDTPTKDSGVQNDLLVLA